MSFREASKAQNPRRVLFKDSWKAQNLRKVSFRDALGSLGAENETWHSEHLGGLGSEIFQTGTKTDPLDHLGGLGRRMIQNGAKTDHMEQPSGLGSEMVQNLLKHLGGLRLALAIHSRLRNRFESI